MTPLISTGTAKGTLCAGVWQDLCQAITSPECPEASPLGMQLLHDSLHLLRKRFISLRLDSGKTAYSAVFGEYVPLIGQYLRQLCFSMVTRSEEDVTMETYRTSEGEHQIVIELA